MTKSLKKIIALFLTLTLALSLSFTYSEAKVKVSAVKSFKQSKATTSSITLKWKKVSKASGYQIQLKDEDGFYTVKTISKAKTTSYKETDLEPGTSYTFRIRAFKKSGKKKIYSAWKKITAKTKAEATTTEESTAIDTTRTETTTNNNTTNNNTTNTNTTNTNTTNTNTDTSTNNTNTTTDTSTQQPTSSTVYTTATGKKYHSTKSCKGLNNAKNIYEKSESDAINSGLTKCDLCY